MFAFAASRPRRRPSLTPMIDVVFLLLVFFMLAARFGQDMVIPLSAGTGTAEWLGPPRLIALSDDGLSLNGVPVTLGGLADRLGPLMPTPDAPVLLQPRGQVDLARLAPVLDALRDAGLANVILVEAGS